MNQPQLPGCQYLKSIIGGNISPENNRSVPLFLSVLPEQVTYHALTQFVNLLKMYAFVGIRQSVFKQMEIH